MDSSRPSESNQTLSPEQTAMLSALTVELQKLNRHRFVRVHNSIFRLISFQFVRGLAFGLGSVIGATLLLSVVVWGVAQVATVPIIGDWLAQIVDQIELERLK